MAMKVEVVGHMVFADDFDGSDDGELGFRHPLLYS